MSEYEQNGELKKIDVREQPERSPYERPEVVQLGRIETIQGLLVNGAYDGGVHPQAYYRIR